MICKIEEVDTLIQQLSEEYTVETANPKKVPDLYLEETLALMQDTPYITDEAYFYLLSQYGEVLVSGGGVSFGIFGFGYWEGMAITDYPLLNDAGVYVFADNANEDEMLYFAFHGREKAEQAVWVSQELEKDYKPGYNNLSELLTYILHGGLDR